jgi:hypothetical protein
MSSKWKQNNLKCNLNYELSLCIYLEEFPKRERPIIDTIGNPSTKNGTQNYSDNHQSLPGAPEWVPPMRRFKILLTHLIKILSGNCH